MSWILVLSVLSIELVSPMAMSSESLIPPCGCSADSHPVDPDVDDGTKQILWSPLSAAVKVKRPADEPFCEITR